MENSIGTPPSAQQNNVIQLFENFGNIPIQDHVILTGLLRGISKDYEHIKPNEFWSFIINSHSKINDPTFDNEKLKSDLQQLMKLYNLINVAALTRNSTFEEWFVKNHRIIKDIQTMHEHHVEPNSLNDWKLIISELISATFSSTQKEMKDDPRDHDPYRKGLLSSLEENISKG